MRRMLKDYGAVALLVIAVLVLFGRRPGGPDLHDAAPEISVPDLQGGTVELADLVGSTVVLNFWASWCGPCRQEIPEFSAFAKDHPQVHVIGVAVDSGSAADVERAAKSFGIDYRVAVGDSSIMQRYKVSSLPTTVIIGADGKVKASHVGMLNRKGLEAALR
jgi:thiol-disulfide isomerase/thioredoxin